MAVPSPVPVTALPPPAGQSSNLTNPDTLATAAYASVATCLIATTIPFCLRCYVRLAIKHRLEIEDAVCVLSWCGLVAYYALVVVSLLNHAGTHEWDLLPSQVPNALYWLNASSTTYGLAIMCTKLAVLLLYQRVFFPSRWSRSNLLLKAFMGLLLGFYISTTFAKVWACLPRQRIWDRSVPGACINVSVLFNVSGIFNTVTDFITLLIPIHVVWSLNMKRKQKLGVVAVFTVGSIAPIFSLVGLVVRFRVSGSPDLAYNQLLISLWAGAEVSTGIICVCLPELPTLFPCLRGSSSISGRSNSGLRDGVHSSGNAMAASNYASNSIRGKQQNGALAMGKRDLEYGQDLLDDDSDTAIPTPLEMNGRDSSSPEACSEKDIGLALGGYLPGESLAEQEARDRVAAMRSSRRSEGGIIKTVSMEVTLIPREQT